MKQEARMILGDDARWTGDFLYSKGCSIGEGRHRKPAASPTHVPSSHQSLTLQLYSFFTSCIFDAPKPRMQARFKALHKTTFEAFAKSCPGPRYLSTRGLGLSIIQLRILLDPLPLASLNPP
jgi:hypothetical protein